VVSFAAPATPAQAASAAIGVFYAACNRFSVDVAVTGVTDDGNGLDKFRYVVSDADGKVLYSEDAARRVGTTSGSLVINFNYNGGAPARNPVKFEVLDLDGNNNSLGVIKGQSYDAQCLAASGKATSTRDFRPPNVTTAFFLGRTQVFAGPGTDPLQVFVEGGKTHVAVYRRGDALWVAVDVGGNDLVWVPKAAVNVDINRLGTPPFKIDLSDPAVPSAIVPVSGLISPTGITGFTTTTLRFRTLPNTASEIIARIPPNSDLVVLGRTFNNRWLKVVFNGQQGWVSSGFVVLSGGKISQLPVFEL
jgi:hypothetical protein